MKNQIITSLACIAIAIGPAAPAQTTTTPQGPSDKLVGLWKAKKRFGPDARGTLVIRKDGSAYTANMMGRTVPVRSEAGELIFELPGNQGMFRGKLQGREMRGFWLRPGTPVSGFGEKFTAITPVILTSPVAGTFSGAVDPAEDTFTLYLMITKRPDGSLAVLMRNPE